MLHLDGLGACRLLSVLSQSPVFSPVSAAPSCGWWCEHGAQRGEELFGVLFFSEVPGKQGNSSLPSALEAELVPPFFPKLFLAAAAGKPVGLQKPSGSSSRKKNNNNKNKTSPCVSQSSPPHGLWGPLQPAVTERPLTPLCQRRLDWREQVSSSQGPCSCASGQNREHCGRYALVPTPV